MLFVSECFGTFQEVSEGLRHRNYTVKRLFFAQLLVDLLRDFGAMCIADMCVNVLCHGGGGVAEKILRIFYGHIALKKHRRIAVPELVGRALDAGGLDEL